MTLDKVGRVLFLKDYASYIKDSMIADLSDFSRNLMLSIDILPIPTDEAVKEIGASFPFMPQVADGRKAVTGGPIIAAFNGETPLTMPIFSVPMDTTG